MGIEPTDPWEGLRRERVGPGQMQEPLPPAGAQQSVHHGAGWGVDGRTGHGRQVGDRTGSVGIGWASATVPAGSRSIGRKRRSPLCRPLGRYGHTGDPFVGAGPSCCEPPAPTGLSSSCRSLKLTLRL